MHELAIHQGEDIKQAVLTYVLENGWEDVILIGGVGSVIDVELANPATADLPPRMERLFIQGPCEVLSFTGEVIVKEKMDEILKKVYANDPSPLFVHIHLSCSGRDGTAYGGAVRSGRAFRSIRMFFEPVCAG
jgi:predicted DNA-binding protein with PD1-like motif